MSDTPRTDAFKEEYGLPDLPDEAPEIALFNLCRTIERELAEAKARAIAAENDFMQVHKNCIEARAMYEDERRAREEAEQSYADCKATLKDERFIHSEHIRQLKHAASEEIQAANKRAEEAERNVKHYVSKYEMVMNALADSDGDATGVIIAFQKRAEQAEAQVKEYAKGIVDLSKTMRYLVGIAERGEGRVILPDETPETFVLGYVKRIEARVKELEEQASKKAETLARAHDQLATTQKDAERYRNAVLWALGDALENGESFTVRGESDPPYWWRRRLREISGIEPTAIDAAIEKEKP